MTDSKRPHLEFIRSPDRVRLDRPIRPALQALTRRTRARGYNPKDYKFEVILPPKK